AQHAAKTTWLLFGVAEQRNGDFNRAADAVPLVQLEAQTLGRLAGTIDLVEDLEQMLRRVGVGILPVAQTTEFIRRRAGDLAQGAVEVHQVAGQVQFEVAVFETVEQRVRAVATLAGYGGASRGCFWQIVSRELYG